MWNPVDNQTKYMSFFTTARYTLIATYTPVGILLEKWETKCIQIASLIGNKEVLSNLDGFM